VIGKERMPEAAYSFVECNANIALKSDMPNGGTPEF
jgi:hypothetical protein